MQQAIAALTYLVRDYDEAIAFFTQSLGFTLVEDSPRENRKRWVLVAPPNSPGPALLLAKAVTPQQAACIGNQTGGRVFLFLHTDNFARDYEAYKTRGVNFMESPRNEPYGTVAVFTDLYGNKWDLIEPRKREPT